MVAFRNVCAAFVKISILISCGILVSAPAAAYVRTWRIPYEGCLFDIIDEKEVCDLYTFDTYDEAVAAIEDWNDNYSERYRDGLDAWAAECAEIASDVEEGVQYESLGKAVVISPDERFLSTEGESTVWVEHDRRSARAALKSRQETTAWLEREVEVVERILPAYEFPEPPDPGEPYGKARNAYSQIHTDGLTLYEWRVLRFALFDTNYFRRERSLPPYFWDEDRPLGRLVDEGYVTVDPRERRTFWEALAGNLRANFDLEFTAAGKEYLHRLADRCCDFRERMAEEARGLGKITAAEYEQLHNDNQCIRKRFHKQIDRPRDWEGYVPYKLERVLRSFEIRGEGLLSAPCPYTRVIECIPEYEPAPSPAEPEIVPGGTYIHDARGELRAVELY